MTPSSIRNFCVVSHIDDGKTTLTDRFLELTQTVSRVKMTERYLDSNPIEKERGITIKLAPVRMEWHADTVSQPYILNLIDTPGHVDFSYEVSRSLAACEGAILLVDATQGIQAQTLANFYNALNQNLEIIPVINKIDMINADVEGVKKDLCQNLGFNEDEIILVSAKDGTGVDKIFPEIIEKVPQPQGKITNPFRALIFDSIYDQHKGVILYIRIVDGEINKTNRVKMMVTKAETEILELGYLSPTYHVADSLHAGEVGFIATGLKNLSLCHVGDTVIKSQNSVSLIPLPGYRK